jgi:hypothetical protein
MRGIQRKFWRILTAQVAVLLLLIQSAIGIAACPHRYADVDPFGIGVVCSVHDSGGSANNGNTPANDPSLNCPLCMAYCHAATILACLAESVGDFRLWQAAKAMI